MMDDHLRSATCPSFRLTLCPSLVAACQRHQGRTDTGHSVPISTCLNPYAIYTSLPLLQNALLIRRVIYLACSDSAMLHTTVMQQRPSCLKNSFLVHLFSCSRDNGYLKPMTLWRRSACQSQKKRRFIFQLLACKCCWPE